MVATIQSVQKQEFLLPSDVDLYINSGPLTEENERVVLAFIKKSKANRRRRERYAQKKTLQQKNTTPSPKESLRTVLAA